MNRAIVVALIIVLGVGGLLFATKVRAPKPPPPTTQEIWQKEGIPVETAAISRGDMNRTVEVTGDINALTKATLSAKIPGRIAQVFKREGDAVGVGTTIAMLDQQDALSNVQQAQAALDSAKTRLSQAVTNAKVTKIQTDAAIEQAKSGLSAAQDRLAVVKQPSRSQELVVAENNVASAKASLDNAEADFKRNERLLKDGAISQSSFDVARTSYLVAQAHYKSAEEQLSLAKEGGRREDVSAAKAQVDMAREQLRTAKADASQNLLREQDVSQANASIRQSVAALEFAKQQLSYTYIKSPIAGEVAMRSAETGQVVSPGQPLADVVNLGSVYLKAEISETELTKVSKGQAVDIQVDAIPDRAFQGSVSEVFPSGSSQSRNFFVRIKIDRPGSLIKPGMFGRGSIITGVDSNVLLAPKDAIEDRRGTKMVFVVGEKHAVKRVDIEVVQENRDHVEVAASSGLAAGDLVVTRGRQNLQDKSLVKVASPKSKVKSRETAR